jgi:hypothetical protein
VISRSSILAPAESQLVNEPLSRPA